LSGFIIVDNRLFLLRHRELTVVFIPVGEGEGDDVVARIGDVVLDAVGGEQRRAVDQSPRVRGDGNGDLAEVLGEGHHKVVAVDGGLDGGTFGGTLYSSLFNGNVPDAINNINDSAIGTAPCCLQNQS